MKKCTISLKGMIYAMEKKRICISDLILIILITILLTSMAWKVAYAQMVENWIIEYDTETFEKLFKVRSLVDRVYLNEYDREKAVEGAINGMLESLGDPYTTYLDKDTAEQFLLETEGEYEGVGIYVSYDTAKEMVIVITPIEGSPAAEAGVLPGDYILSVDGMDAVGAELDEISNKLKGIDGTTVNVVFARYDKEGNVTKIEKTLTRRKVIIDPVIEKVYENNIGYIKLSSFDENTDEAFLKSYNNLVNNVKVKGLIIDLRNNPGGLLDTATNIADALVPKGKIFYSIDKEGKEETVYSNPNQIKIPLVVLINEGSASASEVLAGAIKDYCVGKIVGVKSYGKGVVQSLINLRDGSYIKVTTSEYFSPNGNKINGVGVVPDIEVKLPEDLGSYYNLSIEEDIQLKTAIEELKKMM